MWWWTGVCEQPVEFSTVVQIAAVSTGSTHPPTHHHTYLVGLRDGPTVGGGAPAVEGPRVGGSEGVMDGSRVGLIEGLPVTPAASVGTRDGIWDGARVGAALGLAVGRRVGTLIVCWVRVDERVVLGWGGPAVGFNGSTRRPRTVLVP